MYTLISQRSECRYGKSNMVNFIMGDCECNNEMEHFEDCQYQKSKHIYSIFDDKNIKIIKFLIPDDYMVLNINDEILDENNNKDWIDWELYSHVRVIGLFFKKENKFIMMYAPYSNY